MRKNYLHHPYRVRLNLNKASGPVYQREAKSKRSSEFLHEQAIRLRRRVSFYFALIIAVYLFYFLFYSDYFTINNFNLSGNLHLPKEEVEKVVKEGLRQRHWLIFSQNNYFSLNKKKLLNYFQTVYVLDELKIDKQWPNTLNLTLVDRVGQLLV
ncbi:MAG: FtsQ-type POTRA domain-containing protein, partial [Candidatus Magasanikbacteria bacterium]|nr:FtsQ-type POTRA domain-containing protein [Candidatus Magasanikbacteria bacterium]